MNFQRLSELTSLVLEAELPELTKANAKSWLAAFAKSLAGEEHADFKRDLVWVSYDQDGGKVDGYTLDIHRHEVRKGTNVTGKIEKDGKLVLSYTFKVAHEDDEPMYHGNMEGEPRIKVVGTVSEEMLTEDLGELVDEYTDKNKMYHFEGPSGVQKFAKLVGVLGYSSVEGFLEDNSGAVEAMLEWIKSMSISEWREALEAEVGSHEERHGDEPVSEGKEEKFFVVVKVGFDYGDNDKAGFAYAVFDAKSKEEAEAFAKKAESIDWNDNDDMIHHMAQNVYGINSASHGFTQSAKVVTKEPEGAKYFGGYRIQDAKFED